MGNRLEHRSQTGGTIVSSKAHAGSINKASTVAWETLRQVVRPAIFVWLVFCSVLVAHLHFAQHYSYPIPYWDETGFIPYITNTRPITLDWLWSQANEHRILVHRLTYLLVVKLFGLDSRILNSISVLLMGATAAITLSCLARSRTGLKYSDALVPLLLLHFGHHPNTTWPIQMGFVLVTCLFCATVLLIGYSEDPPGAKVVASLGLMIFAMCLCGAHGLPAASVLALYLGWMALRYWHESPGVAKLSLAFVVITYALVILYFVDYKKITLTGRPFSIENSVIEAIKALSTTLGPYAFHLWPYGGVAIGLVSAGTAVLLIARLRRAGDRNKAVGLLLALVAVAVLALGIGFGRAVLGPDAGFASRYATFMTPLLLIIYLNFSLFDYGTAGRFMRMLLFAAVFALFWPNSRYEIAAVNAKLRDGQALEREVGLGMPIRKLARDYGPQWMFSPSIFEENMRMLARARMGIYRRYPPPDQSSELLDILSENTEIKGSDNNSQIIPLSDFQLPGKLALMAQPVHKCQLPVNATVRKARFGFGIFPSEFKGKVEFRFSVGTAGRVETIWSRVLDPMRSSDRGIQHAIVDLPSEVIAGSRLVFETLSLQEGSAQPAFWTDLSLE